METPSPFEVAWGWEFLYHLNLVERLQVRLKLHGGGNFDNVLLFGTAYVIFKFCGGWNCLEEV